MEDLVKLQYNSHSLSKSQAVLSPRKKRTKLTEKSIRMPDIRQVQFEEIIQEYLPAVEQLNTEQGRSHRFSILLQQLLGVVPGFIETYCTGFEKFLKVRQKDRILKGRVDNLFGNVVVEFEKSIPEQCPEAIEQLQRYVAILWSQEPPDARTPYLCIATDGVRFVTYTPKLISTAAKDISPENINLHVLEECDWTKLKFDTVFHWLDRYFLRKEVLPPTSETIVDDFGVNSHAFQTTTNALLMLWQEIKHKSDFAVIYHNWEKYLRIVYGSGVAGDELFIRHTYLATLAKLMSWVRISEAKSLLTESEISEILGGEYFKNKAGIENFIEEDFFSWLARSEAAKVGIGIMNWLFSLLQNYNLRELSEDVLKSLYQELVDPETRHDLGESYTPDWLAHRIVNRLLDTNLEGSLLDPACGSGTFLYLAIKEKRKRLGDSARTLKHILDSVYGADIHPLAAIIAKTNYILALGDLLKKRKGMVNIPVYLSDTLKLPEQIIEGSEYVIKLDSRCVFVHSVLLESLAFYDESIELAKEFAQENKGKTIEIEHFQNFLTARDFLGSDNEHIVTALFKIVKELKHFIDTQQDTIWAFILKNIYKPLFFKRKFDFVMGNPPWIAFRFMEPAYQAFLKQYIVEGYRLLTGRGELITHFEVATLFFLRAADLYLRSGGMIAFVLPRSIFSADQHDGLRKWTFRFSEDTGKNLSWHEIWDCKDISPLFNIPACVLIAKKGETAKVEYPVLGQILSGRLRHKNTPLTETEKIFTVKDVEFSLHTRGKRSFWTVEKMEGAHAASYYKKHFQIGACIYPRCFWFVQVKPSPLGFNADLPPLETADRAMEEAKDAYKGVYFKDTLESRFLYVTLLSTDLLPFGHLNYRLVALPVEPQGDHYRIINAEEARARGFLHMARWLEKAEKEWAERRGAKAEKMNVYERIDRFHSLTRQNPQTTYRVIYNTSGTFLAAAIVENKPIPIEISGQDIATKGLIVDVKHCFFETNDTNEALFLASVLNAPIIDSLIKPMQSRGLFGPRDIHKKVLELPIPKFSTENPKHHRLVELGEHCTKKVLRWLESPEPSKIKNIGRLRNKVRGLLKEELEEIDALVKEILKGASSPIS